MQLAEKLVQHSHEDARQVANGITMLLYPHERYTQTWWQRDAKTGEVSYVRDANENVPQWVKDKEHDWRIGEHPDYGFGVRIRSDFGAVVITRKGQAPDMPYMTPLLTHLLKALQAAIVDPSPAKVD